MDKSILTLGKGTKCTAWNYSGQRLAAGMDDGSLVVYGSADPASSTFSCTSRFKVRDSSIVKVVWGLPEYGDAVACISADGAFSLWEEVVEDGEGPHWRLCKCFDGDKSQVLDAQFGDGQTCLKLVAAYSNGQIKIYELLDTLEMEKWQLQAEFQNVVDLVSKFGNANCLSASISWNPQKDQVQHSSFVVGFNSNIPALNSPKVWEFDLDHQRWVPVAELSLHEDRSDPVYVVAWAPNIGRPYELIAVATQKGISIWHLDTNPNPDGRLSAQRVAMLSGHDNEVWEMQWDMSGMTLATTGGDGVVRVWQSNLNGMGRKKGGNRLNSLIFFFPLIGSRSENLLFCNFERVVTPFNHMQCSSGLHFLPCCLQLLQWTQSISATLQERKNTWHTVVLDLQNKLHL